MINNSYFYFLIVIFTKVYDDIHLTFFRSEFRISLTYVDFTDGVGEGGFGVTTMEGNGTVAVYAAVFKAKG